MIIDVRSEESVYITINGTVYYIDDSTNEQIMEKWKDKKNKTKKRKKDEIFFGGSYGGTDPE
jgi:hypothetical protein